MVQALWNWSLNGSHLEKYFNELYFNKLSNTYYLNKIELVYQLYLKYHIIPFFTTIHHN